MAPQTVIFVGLGTLTEYSEIDRQAWNAAFRALGLRWDWSRDTYCELMRHGGDRDLARRFAQFIGEDIDITKLEELHQRSFAARMTRDAALRQGVADTLKWAATAGIRLGFVSRHEASFVGPVLAATARARAGVEFDAVFTQSKGLKPAPYPDAVFAVLDELSASEAVVIADTPASAAAGLDAGVPVLAYPGRLAEDQHFPAGVVGPLPPSPEILQQMMSDPLRTAAE